MLRTSDPSKHPYVRPLSNHALLPGQDVRPVLVVSCECVWLQCPTGMLWMCVAASEGMCVSGNYCHAVHAMQGSVWTAVVFAFGAPWARAGLIKLVHDCVNLSSPYFLRKLLQHIQQEGDEGSGLVWALALFCCGMTTAILVNQYFLRVYNVSLFMKSSLIQFLYDKSLRLSLTAKSALGPGKISNLQSNDAAKLHSLPNYGHVLWSGPFQVCLPVRT